MNMKKIIAGAVASVMAVSTMAASSFAADNTGFLTVNLAWGGGGDQSAENVKWTNDFNSWDGANVTVPEGVNLTRSTAKDFELTFTVEIDEEAFKAAWLAAGDDYSEESFYTDAQILVIGTTSLKKVIYVEQGKSSYSFTTTADKLNQQDEAKDPEGWFTQIQKGHIPEIKSLTVAYTDKSAGAGNDDTTAEETKPTESGDAATTTDAAATTTGAAGNTNKPTNDKNNADTGIEGVAIVAGLAVLAAGAVVVAKKRK